MKTSLSVIVLTIVLLLASCTSNKTITSKSSDIYGAGVVQYPVVAEIEVSPTKISGTVVWKGGGASTNTLKEMAISEAVKSANADVLVEPRFEVEVKGRKRTVTATGFPAKYKSFRNAELSDTLIVKIGAMQQTEEVEPATNPKKTRRTVAVVGGAVGAFLLSLLLLW